MRKPFADIIRPATLDEVVGQRPILGPRGLLRRLIDKGDIPNMIFYGPSGTGKTTVANIIAANTNRTLYKLNATHAGIADIAAIIDSLDTFLAPNGALIYLDEIQYFNKKQQQSLLEFMENGKITLIASTTENPYFAIFNAVLSRSTVFEFKPLTAEELIPAIERAIRLAGEGEGVSIECEDGVVEYIASACGGDARKAVTAIELLLSAAPAAQRVLFSMEDAEQVTQRSAMRYDRDGDSHYDILSAFQKSIRGSDPDAAVHDLARLLAAGDLLSACRRLLVTAAEDIGLAYPQAMPIVKACVDAALQIGLPEAQIPMAEAVILCATAPKSNSAIGAISAAMADLEKGAGDIPAHLMDGHYKGAAKLGRALTYEYPHNFPNHYVAQQYLPEALKNATYYKYGENKLETASKLYWTRIKGEKDA